MYRCISPFRLFISIPGRNILRINDGVLLAELHTREGAACGTTYCN